jgi:hypothetical protein
MITKKYNNNDIVTIKLSSGEEIICKVVEDNDNTMIISKPIALVVTPKGAAMTQFLMMQDMNETVELQKDHIVLLTKANKIASDQYIATTSGIQPASAMPDQPPSKIIT